MLLKVSTLGGFHGVVQFPGVMFIDKNAIVEQFCLMAGKYMIAAMFTEDGNGVLGFVYQGEGAPELDFRAIHQLDANPVG
jgi:hypothetical protein